jgi:hypothetical protein
MAVTYQNNGVVRDGLVFYADPSNQRSWLGPDSNTVNSLVKNITGSIAANTSGSYGLNTSFEFDGTDDLINLDFVPQTDLSINFTLLSWANIPALANNGYGTVTGVYDFVNTGGQNRARFFQRIERSGANYLHFVGFGTEQISAAANPTIISNFSVNTWVNLAVTYDGTNIKMYSNGDLDGTVNAGSIGNLPPQGNFDGKLYIGATNRLNSDNVTHVIGNTLIGKVGPIQIYNKALSASEVTQNYNALKNRFI